MTMKKQEEAVTAVGTGLREVLAELPVALILHCPDCGTRHVDEGEFAKRMHHTHSCQICGLTWRPALVPTIGVRFLPGFKSEPANEPLVKETTRGMLAFSGPLKLRAGETRTFVVGRDLSRPSPLVADRLSVSAQRARLECILVESLLVDDVEVLQGSLSALDYPPLSEIETHARTQDLLRQFRTPPIYGTSTVKLMLTNQSVCDMEHLGGVALWGVVEKFGRST